LKEGPNQPGAGQPAAVLLRLYNRRGQDTVHADGHTEMIGAFRRLLETSTDISHRREARSAAKSCGSSVTPAELLRSRARQITPLG
jgi:hypothetical protein